MIPTLYVLSKPPLPLRLLDAGLHIAGTILIFVSDLFLKAP